MNIVNKSDSQLQLRLTDALEEHGAFVPMLEQICEEFRRDDEGLRKANKRSRRKAGKPAASTTTLEYVAHRPCRKWSTDRSELDQAQIVKDVMGGIVFAFEMSSRRGPGQERYSKHHRVLFYGRAEDVQFASQLYLSQRAVLSNHACGKFGSPDCHHAIRFTCGVVRGMAKKLAHRRKEKQDLLAPMREELARREEDALLRFEETLSRAEELIDSSACMLITRWRPLEACIDQLIEQDGFDFGLES